MIEILNPFIKLRRLESKEKTFYTWDCIDCILCILYTVLTVFSFTNTPSLLDKFWILTTPDHIHKLCTQVTVVTIVKTFRLDTVEKVRNHYVNWY